MPSLRKLTPAAIAALEQPPPGVRARIAREYDLYLAGFVQGDYGQAAVLSGEQRAVVRRRLHAAARRRGLRLRFRPGPTPALIFRVAAAPAPVARPTPAAGADQQRNGAMRRPPPPAGASRRRQPAAERYREVLPRWMRKEQAAGRRGEQKRRAR